MKIIGEAYLEKVAFDRNLYLQSPLIGGGVGALIGGVAGSFTDKRRNILLGGLLGGGAGAGLGFMSNAPPNQDQGANFRSAALLGGAVSLLALAEKHHRRRNSSGGEAGSYQSEAESYENNK